MNLLLLLVLLAVPLFAQSPVPKGGLRVTGGARLVSDAVKAGGGVAGTLEVVVISELAGVAGAATLAEKIATAPAIFKKRATQSSTLNNPAVYSDLAAGSTYQAVIENLPAFSYTYGTCTGANCLPGTFPSTPTCTLGATASVQGECSTAANITVSASTITRVVFKADGISNYQGAGTDLGAGTTTGGRDFGVFPVTTTNCTGAGSLQQRVYDADGAGGGWIYPDPGTFGIGGSFVPSCTTLNTEGELHVSGSNLTIDLHSVRTRKLLDFGVEIQPLRNGSTCHETTNVIIRGVEVQITDGSDISAGSFERGGSSNECPSLAENPQRHIMTHNSLGKEYPTGSNDDVFGARAGLGWSEVSIANNIIGPTNSNGYLFLSNYYSFQHFFNVLLPTTGARQPFLMYNGTDAGSAEPTNFQHDFRYNISLVGSSFGMWDIARRGWAQMVNNHWLASSYSAGVRRIMNQCFIELNASLDPESNGCDNSTAKLGVATGNIAKGNFYGVAQYNVNLPLAFDNDFSISTVEHTADLGTITPYSADPFENAKQVLQRAGSRPLSTEAATWLETLWTELLANAPNSILDQIGAEGGTTAFWSTAGHITVTTAQAASGTRSFVSGTTGGDAILMNGLSLAKMFFTFRTRWAGTCPATDTPLVIFKDAADAEIYRIEFSATTCQLAIDRAGVEETLGNVTDINTWYHARAYYRSRLLTGTCTGTAWGSLDSDCNMIGGGQREGNTSRATKRLAGSSLQFGGAAPVVKSMTFPQAPSGFTYYLDDFRGSTATWCGPTEPEWGGCEYVAP